MGKQHKKNHLISEQSGFSFTGNFVDLLFGIMYRGRSISQLDEISRLLINGNEYEYINSKTQPYR